MNENNQVLEGFICPMCMTDFKTPNYLTKHFEEFHNDDPEILKSLKGIYLIVHCNDKYLLSNSKQRMPCYNC